MLDVEMPLPRELTTPPVTKMYLRSMAPPSTGPQRTTVRRADRRALHRAADALWYAPRDASRPSPSLFVSHNVVAPSRGAPAGPGRTVRDSARRAHPAPVGDALIAGGSVDRKGILFVMTGASGVGKDTIRQAALPDMGDVHYSVSATTRERRPGEVHGKQYYFHSTDEFESLIANDGLLEHAEYVGDYYGTSRAPLEAALARGQDVLLELELVGAREVKRKVDDAVMIFIAPPTLIELERRLRGRGTDSEAKIQKRLSRARAEIKAVREFDYVVVNDELDIAVRDFLSILWAERARADHLTDQEVATFLKEL